MCDEAHLRSVGWPPVSVPYLSPAAAVAQTPAHTYTHTDTHTHIHTHTYTHTRVKRTSYIDKGKSESWWYVFLCSVCVCVCVCVCLACKASDQCDPPVGLVVVFYCLYHSSVCERHQEPPVYIDTHTHTHTCTHTHLHRCTQYAACRHLQRVRPETHRCPQPDEACYVSTGMCQSALQSKQSGDSRVSGSQVRTQ